METSGALALSFLYEDPCLFTVIIFSMTEIVQVSVFVVKFDAV